MNPSKRSDTAAVILRRLARVYPRSFRRRFEDGFHYALLRDYESAREGGRAAAARFWIRTLSGLFWYGLAERIFVITRVQRREGSRAAGLSERREERMEADQMTKELRFALRRLLRRPAFTLAAAVTLALGIGATTAIFSIVNGVILRPLPYPDPDRVVVVAHRSTSAKTMGMPDAGYFYYREESSTLENLAAYIESSATITGTGEPLELGIIQATPSLFATLRVSPVMGRDFTAEDAERGADPVAIVSHTYWRRYLGSAPDAIGQPVVKGSRTLVIGVLPQGFEFPRPNASVVFGNRFESPDLYVPLRMDRSRARFGNFMYQGVGRLNPGAGIEQAGRELNRLMPLAAEAFPAAEERGGYTPEGLKEAGYRAVVMTVKDAIVGDIAKVLWILLSAVGVVLMIAVANVANLFLVRGEARRREIAVQRALGADRRSLVRSFLSESGLLALLGCGFGILVAWAAARTVVLLAPETLPRLDEVSLDTTVLAFAVAVSLFAALAFSVAPFLRASRLEVAGELASGNRQGTAGRSRRRGQKALVIFQVAFALVLLVSSGLLLRTFLNLRSVRPGFDPSNVLTLKLSLGENIVRGAGFDDGPDDAVRSRFMIDLMDRLEAIPGVRRAAFTADLPLNDDLWYDYVATEGAVPDDLADGVRALRVFMGPGYLETIGARIRAGRELLAREFVDQPRSVVVNQAFAELHWPGENPIGKRLLQYWNGMNPEQDVWYTVVGIVEDIRERSLMTPPEPTIYLPTIFLPEGGFAMFVSNMVAVLQTAVPPETLIRPVRETIQGVYPELPIRSIETLEQATARSFQDVTFAMVLLIIAGGVSAILGLVGIYGTVAYVVSQRSREFGLRIALGATAGNVRWGVLKGAGGMGAVGIALGFVAALGAGRIIESLLFGVTSYDPMVNLVVAGGLFVLVLIASLVPAVKASSVDPVEAMRIE